MIKFSIVLRTKNEINNINNFYRSVLHQTYENYEFIVIDNSSTDGTHEFCEENSICVHSMNGERVESGNYGMLNIARGDVIGYFDADMILSPLLLESSQHVFSNSDCVGLHIPEVILGQGILAKSRRFERTFYNGTVIDAARFIRSDILKKVDGFDLRSFPTPSAEDWDLDKRIKKYGRIYLLPESTTSIDSIKTFWNPSLLNIVSRNTELNYLANSGFFHNEINFTLKWYLNKKRYYSRSLNNYIKKWGKNDQDLRMQLGLRYRLFGVFIENGKWKKVLANPFKFLTMYMIISAVGIIYMINKNKQA